MHTLVWVCIVSYRWVCVQAHVRAYMASFWSSSGCMLYTFSCNVGILSVLHGVNILSY